MTTTFSSLYVQRPPPAVEVTKSDDAVEKGGDNLNAAYVAVTEIKRETKGTYKIHKL